MSGLFSTLNTSKSGMFAQQQYINVTSHNISNANTTGFSRQHLVLTTARPQTIPGGVGQVGTGVSMKSIERTRNQFLDYQIRKETTHLGTYGVRQDYLSEIEGIFNEPSDTGISELMSEFFDAWQTLSKNPDKPDARTVVAQKAKALAEEINHTYKKLNDTNTNAIKEIQSNIFEVNAVLDQLNSINKDIITVTVAGNSPNDLMDSRDLLLDTLSNKFGIDTRNQKLNGITCTVEGNSDINFIKNLDSDSINKLAFVNKINDNGDGTYDIEYYKNGDTTSESNKTTLTGVTLSDDQYKSLNENRVLITDVDGNVAGAVGTDGKGITSDQINSMIFSPGSGTVGGLQSIHKDTEGYMKQMDTLAKGVAFAVNAIHSEGYDGGIPFFVNSDGAFDVNSITASNIAINSSILENVMLIQTGNGKPSETGSNDGDRARAIADLRDFALNMGAIENESYTYNDFVTEHLTVNKDKVPTFNTITGGVKVEGYFKNTINKLGVQSEEAQRIVSNQSSLLTGLIQRRLSTSGVSLDEEAVNLIEFQHAFQANAKVISTVDQLLDVVVNLVR